jgi:hypothetical protein
MARIGYFLRRRFPAILVPVTLRTRRRTYWVLFCISLAFLLLGILCAISLATTRNAAVFLIEHGIYRMHSFLGMRISSLTLSIIDTLSLALLAATAGGYILLAFRKTVSAEVFFFAFWLAAHSVESVRLLHLVLAINGMQESGLAAIDKFFAGVRFLGYMTIFISGLHAAGMRSERYFSVIFACFAIAIGFASALPVNTGLWDWNLMFKSGYALLIRGFSAAAMAMTVANYLIAVRLKGDKSYILIAVAIAAITASAYFVGADNTPLISLISILVMSSGCALYIGRLHAYYLWQ